MSCLTLFSLLFLFVLFRNSFSNENLSTKHWGLLDSKVHQCYTQQLYRLAEAVRQKRPDQIKIILQHNNAKPHTAKLTKAKIQELVGKFYPILLIHRTLFHQTTTFSGTYKLLLKVCTLMMKKKSKHGLRTILTPVPEFL